LTHVVWSGEMILQSFYGLPGFVSPSDLPPGDLRQGRGLFGKSVIKMGLICDEVRYALIKEGY